MENLCLFFFLGENMKALKETMIKKDIDAFSENSDRHPTSDIYLLSSFWSLVF